VLKVAAIMMLLCTGLLAATVLPVVAQAVPSAAKSSGGHIKGYDDWHFSINL
jgi:hypothetical protein